MTDGSHAPMQKPSPVQEGVQIVQDMVQCGMSPGHYENQVAKLHQLMGQFAMNELRTNSAFTVAAQTMTVEQVTREDLEDTPMACAYWATTSLYFRKVYQAAAAAA